jgi:uncharacterized protein (UPF0264 family)
VAKLLVSVRSAKEAQDALAGGAAIIDVKEPLDGPLGRATHATWRAVRAAVPPRVPVSVALGELAEWLGPLPVPAAPAAFSGISFVKLGLAGAGTDWRERWRRLRQHLRTMRSPNPLWVAVVYADWKSARAPDPDAVLAEAADADDCRGILIDTWDKTTPSCLDPAWKSFVERARAAGRFVALAGSLDVAAIVRLAPLAPDIFAVRGAACRGGDRTSHIETERVMALARAARHGENIAHGSKAQDFG